jgi:LmbE family N-acetylglucosaminyl deacetylase
VRTIVVTCTRGDLGEHPPGTQDVGALRQRELEAATRRLNVGRLVQLGYGDSGMAGWDSNANPRSFCNIDLNIAAGRIVEVIEQERPQVMVAYDETGGYEHPDHVRAHEVGVSAYEMAREQVRPKRLYFVRFPLGWARHFNAALRSAGIDAPMSAAAGADAGDAEIGTADDLVTTRIDVSNFVPQKAEALRCHASQMPPTQWFMRMPPDLAQDLWRYEHYSLERGSPPTNLASDLFDASELST